MTRFEKDVIEIEEGNEIEVLKRRKAELEDLYQKGRCEKNAFRRQCIAQEYTRKLAEYEQYRIAFYLRLKILNIFKINKGQALIT